MWTRIKQFFCKHRHWKVRRTEPRRSQGWMGKWECVMIGECKGCGLIQVEDRWGFDRDSGSMTYMNGSYAWDR